jgi:hypothetical protein
MPGPVASKKAPFSCSWFVGVVLALSSVALADEVDPGDVSVPTSEASPPADTRDTLGWATSMTPFQASLFPPVQLFTPDTPVYGMRLNVIYGEQAQVWGLDVGTANRITSSAIGLQIGGVNWGRDFTGLQIGGFTLNDSDEPSRQLGMRVNLPYGEQAKFWGFDIGMFNITTMDMRGLQIAIVSANHGTARGLMFGVGNSVQKDFTGLQIGLVNIIEGNSNSVQIGFANAAGDGARVQLGFHNFAKSLKGVQIGIININEARSPLLVMPVVNVGW